MLYFANALHKTRGILMEVPFRFFRGKNMIYLTLVTLHLLAVVVCCVLPLILPSGVLEGLPATVVIAQTAFAFSGIIGLAAVICLGINLWKTVRGG